MPSALDWNEEVVLISSFWHSDGAALSLAHHRRLMRVRCAVGHGHGAGLRAAAVWARKPGQGRFAVTAVAIF